MTIKLIIPFFYLFGCYKYSFSQDTAKYYYESGQLKHLQAKVDSNAIYEKIFYDNGQLMSDGYVKFIQGKYRPLNLKIYYKDGATKVVSCDTSYTMYEQNGKVYFHNQTKDGINNGESFIYFDGLLVLHKHYKNAQMEGKQFSYDMISGKLSSEENYINGKLDGLLKDYDSLVNISQTIFYKNDIVIRATYFDATGKIIKTSNGKEEDKNRRNVENFAKDAFKH